MIPFDFDYYKPTTIEEAFNLFISLKEAGKSPLYFSGGTEIITLGRLDLLYTDAVIDVKGIAECNVMKLQDDYLYIGAAKSLASIEDANIFPLLTKNSKEVADHTAREKITLGGNICGNIFYRESVLPFLLSDSYFVIGGGDGVKLVSIHDIFNKEIQLENGEFLVQTITYKPFLEAPHLNIKRRKQWKTGYPVITVSSLVVDRQIRIAISGLCPFPFRSQKMESYLNEKQLPHEERIASALEHVPEPILTDSEASEKYRIFVLKNILLDILNALEGRMS